MGRKYPAAPRQSKIESVEETDETDLLPILSDSGTRAKGFVGRLISKIMGINGRSRREEEKREQERALERALDYPISSDYPDCGEHYCG